MVLQQLPAVIQADITQLDVDAIVNAANASLEGGGGVDGAIHQAAGPQLLEACRPLAPCPTAEVRVTSAFQLPCRYVLHTVGPVWQGGDFDEAAQLAACYRNCLAAAEDMNLTTIAFPAISCGVYGFPPPQAAPIAIRSLCKHWSKSSPVKQIFLVCFSTSMLEIFRGALREYVNELLGEKKI